LRLNCKFLIFIAYAVFSFLCGYIIKIIGYKRGVVVGLALVAIGSYMFFPAVAILSYPLFLLAIFVMIFAFIVGWFITSANIKDGQLVFDSQIMNGFIIVGIAIINFFLMLLGKDKANVALGIFGTVIMLLIFSAIMLPPAPGMWCLLSIGFFNSIMFPNIFSLSVRDLDPSEMPLASGIINTLIVGGAIVPLLIGGMTDAFSVRWALLIPILCYGYITFFALKGSKIR
jgi:FHS family L-fucose permease-like MFS transporter